MSDTTVILGDISLTAFEIPEAFSLGGDQDLNVHQLIGGQRVIDAMGANDRPIAWSGLIFSTLGQTANTRAQQIDYIRRSGQEVMLSFWSNKYRVVISKFNWDFQRYFQIPYEIEVIVIQDLSSPNDGVTPPINVLMSAGTTSMLASAQLNLNMTIPSLIPGPVSTYTGVTTQPVTAITWNGPPAGGGGVDLTDVAAGLTSTRSVVGNLTSYSGLSPSILAPTVSQLQSNIDTVIAAQSAVDAAMVVTPDSLGGTNIGGVVRGRNGALNAASFSAYQGYAVQDTGLLDTGDSMSRQVDNLDLANGGPGTPPINWLS